MKKYQIFKATTVATAKPVGKPQSPRKSRDLVKALNRRYNKWNPNRQIASPYFRKEV